MISELDAAGPSHPVANAATNYSEQALQRLGALRDLVSSLMGEVEVRPLDHPDHHTHAQIRADYYHAMSDLITTLAGEGRASAADHLARAQRLRLLVSLAGAVGSSGREYLKPIKLCPPRVWLVTCPAG